MAGLSTATSLCTANVNLLTLISTRLLLPLIFANDTVTQADAQRPAEATRQPVVQGKGVSCDSYTNITVRKQILKYDITTKNLSPLSHMATALCRDPQSNTLPSSKLPPPYTNPHFLTVQCGHTPLLPPSNPPPPQ